MCSLGCVYVCLPFLWGDRQFGFITSTQSGEGGAGGGTYRDGGGLGGRYGTAASCDFIVCLASFRVCLPSTLSGCVLFCNYLGQVVSGLGVRYGGVNKLEYPGAAVGQILWSQSR